MLNKGPSHTSYLNHGKIESIFNAPWIKVGRKNAIMSFVMSPNLIAAAFPAVSLKALKWAPTWYVGGFGWPDVQYSTENDE